MTMERQNLVAPYGESDDDIAVLDRVTVKYASRMAVEDLSFRLSRGSIVALLGPNGAGKTTVIRLLLGILRPNSGTVRIFGSSPHRAAVRQHLGVMPQVSRVPEMLRVSEHIDLFRSYYHQPLPFEEIIRAAQLSGLEKRFFGGLSGGQQRRVLFALALAGNPDLIILDEPTAGLDVESRHGLWGQVRSLSRQNRSVLLTTHYLDEADSLADYVLVINEGRLIAQGTTEQIRQTIPRKQIWCKTKLDLDRIRILPGVTDAGSYGNGIRIYSTAAEKTVSELLAEDPQLLGLEVSRPRLEDAFLALTRGNAKPDVRASMAGGPS